MRDKLGLPLLVISLNKARSCPAWRGWIVSRGVV